MAGADEDGFLQPSRNTLARWIAVEWRVGRTESKRTSREFFKEDQMLSVKKCILTVVQSNRFLPFSDIPHKN